MKIYLSGPMTGLPDYNYPAFHAAAAWLRSLGHEVVNPAEEHGGRQDLPYKQYLKHDIRLMLDCDCVALLDGWANSRGATFESYVAYGVGIPVRPLHAIYSADEPEMKRFHLPLALGLSAAAMLAAFVLVFCLNGCAASGKQTDEKKAGETLQRIFRGML